MKNNNSYRNYHSRAVIAPATLNKKERSVEGVLTTERPVLVWDYMRWEPIQEVLLVDGMISPKSGKLPFVDSHKRHAADNVIGSTTDLKSELADDGMKQIICRNIFSQTEEKLFTKVREGHLDSTSVSYEVYDDESITIPPGETFAINGHEWKNDHERFDLVIRKVWKPKENSLLAIGADDRANFRTEIVEKKEEKKPAADPVQTLDGQTADNIRRYFQIKN